MSTPYCLICEKEVLDVEKHIYEVHLREPELKRNRGRIKCRLCKIKVNDMRRHIHSKLHKYNILKDAVLPENTVEDYIRHYEMLSESKEDVDRNREHPFWTAAGEALDKEEYERLEVYIYGRKRGKVRRRGTVGARYIKRKRHGVNPGGIGTDSKEVLVSRENSCLQGSSG